MGPGVGKQPYHLPHQVRLLHRRRLPALPQQKVAGDETTAPTLIQDAGDAFRGRRGFVLLCRLLLLCCFWLKVQKCCFKKCLCEGSEAASADRLTADCSPDSTLAFQILFFKHVVCVVSR